MHFDAEFFKQSPPLQLYIVQDYGLLPVKYSPSHKEQARAWQRQKHHKLER
jgi:hypothetical protein